MIIANERCKASVPDDIEVIKRCSGRCVSDPIVLAKVMY